MAEHTTRAACSIGRYSEICACYDLRMSATIGDRVGGGEEVAPRGRSTGSAPPLAVAPEISTEPIDAFEPDAKAPEGAHGLKEHAAALLKLVPRLRAAGKDSDRAALLATLHDVLDVPVVQRLVDKNADAVAIGFSFDFHFGVGVNFGKELVYIRAKDGRPPQLQVNSLAGWLSVLGVGNFAPIAFVRGIYGDPDAIASTCRRHTLALGLIYSTIAFFRMRPEPGPGWAPFVAGAAVAGGIIGYLFGAVDAFPIGAMAMLGAATLSDLKDRLFRTGPSKSARGWTNTVGNWVIGLTPFDHLAVSSVRAKPTASVTLTEDEAKEIEARIALCPDRANLRNLVGADAHARDPSSSGEASK
jgi:hypothetical protein